MDVDSQPSMEETILVGDNLMGKLTSPVIPPEIASHLLYGVDTCDQSLRNLFLCLQVNDIEPFCQDEIVLYQQCVQRRFYSSLLHLYDEELRKRLGDSEYKLGLSMPIDEAKERASQLESEATGLDSGKCNKRRTRIPPEMELEQLLYRYQSLVLNRAYFAGEGSRASSGEYRKGRKSL